jgi:hypothetical protein
LIAAVFDERVAVCFASCSGLGGAQMARHDWGETIDDLAQLSPQNYCENLQYWISHYDEMPLDSHFPIYQCICIVPTGFYLYFSLIFPPINIISSLKKQILF